MKISDLSQNRTIARLLELTRQLRESQSSDDTISALRRGLAEVSGFVASVLLSTRGLAAGQYRLLQILLDPQDPRDFHTQPEGEEGGPQCGGVMGEIVNHLGPLLIQDVDWSSDPHFRQTLSEYHSLIAVPMAADHLSLNWFILLKKFPECFTDADLETAVERVALAGALLENQALAQELDFAKQKIDQDAQQVGKLQRALLPQILPWAAGLEIAVSYEPSGRAGGDLYDLFPLDEAVPRETANNCSPSRWCIFIGDIAGHGLAAAVVAAILQTALRIHPPGATGPAKLLMHVNQYLCSEAVNGFATAFLACYEPETRRLTYANAGHPSPLLRRSSDGSVHRLEEVKTYPLRIDQAQAFTEASVQLQLGDTIVLYTDGITEARGPTGELFDESKLSQFLRDEIATPTHLIEQIRGAVRDFEHGRPAADDQTLVVVRVQ
jgi:phosphoserine phosphatase RsbU/P